MMVFITLAMLTFVSLQLASMGIRGFLGAYRARSRDMSPQERRDPIIFACAALMAAAGMVWVISWLCLEIFSA